MSPRLFRAAPIGVLFVLLVSTAVAQAAPSRTSPKTYGSPAYVSDGASKKSGWLGVRPVTLRSNFSLQHEGDFDHLPSVQNNVELVSKLKMDTPGVGGVAAGQIADVAVYKNAAYLQSWGQPINPETGICERGGFFSVDISDPSAPRQLAFVPALAGNYHGEGAHALTFPDGRDVLAVNNERCAAEPERGGGFDLYDVSDPAHPITLIQAAGEYGDLDTFVCCSPEAEGAEYTTANDYHSVVMWRDGDKVYLIGVDNFEAPDVDIYDITNPSAPKPVAEYDLEEEFPEIVDSSGLGNGIFLHDMVVKEINGVQTLLASYWDGGYVLLNVDDPANAQYIGDTTFGDVDKLTGQVLPTGNGHQAEFSADNKYFLAADEDFDQYRLVFDVAAEPAYKTFVAGLADEGPRVTPDAPLEGDTRFVGQACEAGSIAAPSEGVTIAVAERGTCNFQVKTENVEAAGYEALIIFNSNSTSSGCDQVIGLDFVGYTGDIPTMLIPRKDGLRLLGAYNEATYSCVAGNNALTTPAPPAPREGFALTVSSQFDGWGYAHLYRNASGKLEEVGQPYAIEESLDERFAVGFGDLSIHEFATDPQTNLGYISYYSGGVRVVSFGEDGITERGRFIDKGGNNFWGIEQFTTAGGQRLMAASDRDYGLYILKYTGPGAPQPPQPQQAPAGPAPTPPAAKDTTKPRITLLSSGRQRISSLRGKGLTFKVRVDEAAKLSLSLRGRFTSKLKRGARGKAQMVGKGSVASVQANKSVTVTIRPSAALRKKLRSEKRLPAMFSVTATDAAGNKSTRTKVITFR